MTRHYMKFEGSMLPDWYNMLMEDQTPDKKPPAGSYRKTKGIWVSKDNRVWSDDGVELDPKTYRPMAAAPATTNAAGGAVDQKPAATGGGTGAVVGGAVPGQQPGLKPAAPQAQPAAAQPDRAGLKQAAAQIYQTTTGITNMMRQWLVTHPQHPQRGEAMNAWNTWVKAAQQFQKELNAKSGQPAG